MRRIIVVVGAFGLLLAACAKSTTTTTAAQSPTGPSGATSSPSATPAATVADCAKSATFKNPSQLTVGTSNPAYPPWFSGGTTKDSMWKVDDPNDGKGLESAVTYEVAKRLGFSRDQVNWIVTPFPQTYAPGPKDYDFTIQQISYTAKRAQAVDFSESYYDVNQALVAVKGTPVTKATSLADLKDFTLAAPIGTTAYTYITDVIQPNKEPGSYQSLSDTVAALNAHQVDAMVVDLPTALYIADPYVQEVKNSVVVGQFPNPAGGTTDHVAIAFQKGSDLVPCVNLALESMKADGTLQNLQNEWLSQKTNVGEVPVFSP